ncbi:hypothetical protein D3C74_407740 [compost metagenome]
MPADIAKPQCAQNSIAHRMQQHIGIGMSKQSFFIGNGDTANNAWPSFHQLVYIETLSYSNHVCTSPLLLCVNSAKSRSSGVVILMLA